jgi:hypothetical protein
MRNRKKKALRTSILAFAVAAIASPAAQAGRIYVDGGAGPAPAAKTTPLGPSVRGVQARLNAQKNSAAAARSLLAPRPSENGFDWGDAGIGAGTAFGATVALLGGIVVLRRNRHGQLAV